MINWQSFSKKGWWGTILALAVLLALCGSLLVGQETTGNVAGRVLDPSGAAVPNAKVELSGGPLSGGITATTNVAGEFSFHQLAVGTGYKLKATASGFRTSTQTGLEIIVGTTVSIDIKMEVGQMTEVVMVAADADMVDTTSSSSFITVDKSFFDVLPKPRGFDGLVALAPGARQESQSAGGYQIDGASGAENTFFINGMEMENVYGGTLSGQNEMPVEMIQQVQVKNGIMEAQYGGAMGGVVSGITRSGTNQIHGEVGFYYNGDGLQGKPRPTLELDPNNYLAARYYWPQQDTFNTWNPVIDLGGPIWKDKLFFFAGFMPTMTNYARTVNFNTGQTGTYYEKDKQEYGNGRVDFNPTSKIRMNMNWVFNPNYTHGNRPATDGTSSYSTDWADLGSFNGGNVLAGQIDYLATNKLILTFRGGYTYTNFNNEYSIPTTTAVYYSGASTTLPPANLQGPNGWVVSPVAADAFNIYTRHNYSADASYMVNWHGQHTIKGGWQMNGLANNVRESSYANGYYRYYWGLTYACQLSDCTGTGAYGYYRYRTLGTIGQASSNNQGIYLQDNWRVNKHLSINYGLRTEREFVPAFYSGTSIPSPAITFNWPQKMSPRVGVAWDPKGDGKQRIYGGWGYFYDIMKYSLPQGSFGGQNWMEYFYTLDDPNLVTKNQGFAPDPTKLPGTLIEVVNYRVPSNDPSQHLIDPNLMPMKQQMIDLGYERSLSPTMMASVRYTDRRLIHAIEDVGHITAEGETYEIANPGYGIVADPSLLAPGIPTTPKAVRDFDAVEFRLESAFRRTTSSLPATPGAGCTATTAAWPAPMKTDATTPTTAATSTNHLSTATPMARTSRACCQPTGPTRSASSAAIRSSPYSDTPPSPRSSP